ncbi:protein SCO1/2 [Salirhabdus euzebyi]|uniref:Protein SCO1/2 n=1 Tax=Salirhabdus euzebyi TaxID=394506 RepID=A0A841Q8L0_9BACI|nr:SCO family protein [Salirhabdus euzebyi]MBB6454725.1 protein SCO1/2 [Salirhabdus euzebyi]
MKKKYYVFFASFIAIGIGLGILYLEFWRDAGVKLPEDITMETASGESFAFTNMEPKVRLVEFFYTKCPSVCPITTQRMMHLRDLFKEEEVFGDKVEFLSITIDPEVDTLEEIEEYMNRYGIVDEQGWVFLRGDMAATEKLAEPFRFQFKDNGTDFIVHTSYTYLLNEKNELIEKFPMGKAFDKERVHDRIMRLID